MSPTANAKKLHAAVTLAIWIVCVSGGLALLASPPSTSPQDPATSDLIEQLNDEEIAKRDAAQRQLQERGEKLAEKGPDDPQYKEFKAQLEAASGSADVEVASRAKKILADVEDFPEIKQRMQDWRSDNGDPRTPEDADKQLKKLQKALDEAQQSLETLAADLAEAQADGRILDEADLTEKLRRTRRLIKAYERLKASLQQQRSHLQKARIEREERRDGLKQFGMQPSPRFNLWAPSIAWDGETFSGVVTAETPSGPVPLAPGDEVVFNGEVVQAVKPDGTIDIPPRALAKERDCDSTNVNYQVTIKRAFGRPVLAAAAGVAGRVELLPPSNERRNASPQLDEPRIARVSSIITGEAPFSVFGHGLDRLKEAALLGDDGSTLLLGPSVGSSLQRIYLPRSDARPPKGELQFVAWDDAGRQLESPHKSRHPQLKLEGTRITHKNQPGEIRVLSDTAGFVQLSGGDPQISVYKQPFPVEANVQKTARFFSREVGAYTVRGKIRSREDMPPGPDAKRARAQVQPLKHAYDRRNNVTRVEVPVQIADDMGKPVAGAAVQMAVSVPHGVEYPVPTTDKLGRALFKLELPGEVSVGAIGPHVFGLPGLTWLPQDKCCDCKTVTYTDNPPIQIMAVDGFNAGAGAEQLGVNLDKAPTLAGWIRIRYKLSPAVVATKGEKRDGLTVTRSTNAAITGPNPSAWQAFYKRGQRNGENGTGLVGFNQTDANGYDTVQSQIVECPGEKRFDGYEYEVWIGLLLEPGAAKPAQLTVKISDVFDKCPGSASTSTPVQLGWDANPNLKSPKLNSASLPPPPNNKNKKK